MDIDQSDEERPSLVILGMGRVGRQLAYAFAETQQFSIQLYTRSPESLREFQNDGRFETTTSFAGIPKDSDFYLLAVSDDAIPKVASDLAAVTEGVRMVAHCSGTVSMDVFRDEFCRYGVFYPLQSFTEEKRLSFRDIPILLSSSDMASLARLKYYASALSGDVHEMEDELRQLLHLPAVLVNNFTNYLYHLAYAYCRKKELDFNLLLPLIRETAGRLKPDFDPGFFQTGPALRGDQRTLAKHLKQIEDEGELKKLYLLFSESIQNSNK